HAPAGGYTANGLAELAHLVTVAISVRAHHEPAVVQLRNLFRAGEISGELIRLDGELHIHVRVASVARLRSGSGDFTDVATRRERWRRFLCSDLVSELEYGAEVYSVSRLSHA